MALFRRPDGIDPRRAAQLLEGGEAVALDVRENLEWTAARIEGALHIPLLHLATRRHELPRGTTIVTVCRIGHRGGLAARALRHAGFQVRNLDGGMKAWVGAGLPLEPPAAGCAERLSGALLALPFGLGIGLLLGLVGGGGSILAVPVLVYVVGEPVKAATTESLLVVGAAALVGAVD